eukprot:scaffold173608_cov24-Tisochrysis_lutea.AAC.1
MPLRARAPPLGDPNQTARDEKGLCRDRPRRRAGRSSKASSTMLRPVAEVSVRLCGRSDARGGNVRRGDSGRQITARRRWLRGVPIDEVLGYVGPAIESDGLTRRQ